MNAPALLDTLQRVGVVVEARGDRLHIEAPAGVLDGELRCELKRLKPELLHILQAQPAQPLRSTYAGEMYDPERAEDWAQLYPGGHPRREYFMDCVEQARQTPPGEPLLSAEEAQRRLQLANGFTGCNVETVSNESREATV